MVNPLDERDVLLAEVEARVIQSLSLLATHLERSNLPHSLRHGLLRAAGLLREALRLTESERFAAPVERPERTPLDPLAFARMVQNNAGLPIWLRVAAQQALSVQERPIPSLARTLLEVSEHAAALQGTLGVSIEDAVARCSQVTEWAVYPPGALLRACKLHQAALYSLTERPA